MPQNSIHSINSNISCYFNRIIGRETKRYEDAENEKIATPQDREKSPPIKCQLLLSWNKSLYQHWYKLLQEWPVQTNERFTRDRLNKLNQYFNVADTSRNPPWRLPEHDKISTHVQLSEYSPHMKVSLEETMVAYTGRFVFKQYFPLKPTKRGEIGCEPIQTMDM